MPKYYITLLVCFYMGFTLCNFCKGQTYTPIPLDSITWRMFIDYEVQFSCHERHVFEYTLKSDTVIGSYTYKAITSDNFALYAHIYGTPYCSIYSFLLGNGNYFGAVRQDTISKEVFFVPQGACSDSLLYDFSLVVGDTLFSSILVPYNIPCADPFDVVQSIDSVLIGGSYRRRWNFDCIHPIIDGIGSTFNPFGTNPDPFFLSCVVIGGAAYDAYGWSKDGFPDSVLLNNACAFVTGISSIEENSGSLALSPNPCFTSTELRFSERESFKSTVSIYDETGRLLFTEIVNATQAELNMENFSNGIYFVRLSSSGFEKTLRLVKIE